MILLETSLNGTSSQHAGDVLCSSLYSTRIYWVELDSSVPRLVELNEFCHFLDDTRPNEVFLVVTWAFQYLRCCLERYFLRDTQCQVNICIFNNFFFTDHSCIYLWTFRSGDIDYSPSRAKTIIDVAARQWNHGRRNCISRRSMSVFDCSCAKGMTDISNRASS
jgi:hypothetical protein